MFGQEQFYPTPEPVIWKMLDGLDLPRKRVLDPSAGDGAILDAVLERTKHSNYHNAETYAIEVDPALRAILADKGHKVIDTDFLAYSGQRYFDYILMNPPFAEGAKHLLKAWEIANGAEIRCLLNAETLWNRCTREREQLWEIVDRHGQVKDLGRPFSGANGARRYADVKVVLVTLVDDRPREAFRLDFDPETVGAGSFRLEEFDASELAPADVFDGYEARFNAAVNAFKRLLATRQEVAYYLDGLLPTHHKDPVAEALHGEKTPDLTFDAFLDDVTAAAWDVLFTKTKLGRVTTEKVRREVEKRQAQQGTMAFTASNMYDLFYSLALNQEHIMTECVLEVFDNLTSHYPENREKLEGWKTNSAYIVGKRFILPYVGNWDSRFGGYGYGLHYESAREIRDIERACCFLTGQKLERIRSVTDSYTGQTDLFGEWVHSEFFKTKLHKKQTMHFEWLDETLRQKFNTVVARERWGWLPEKVKEGFYK